MKVLVPIATEDPSEKVLEWVKSFANNFEAEFHFVNIQHSLETFTYTYPSFPGFIYISDSANPEHDTNALETANKIAKTVADKVCDQIKCNVKAIGKIGDAAEIILTLIESGDYALVILKDRDRTEAGRFFLGSITDKIVHHSGIPVFVIR